MKIKAFNLAVGAQIFKALSDESRIRILHLLQKNGEMCISDLEQILDFTQAKTSRHINYLKNAGLLSKTRVDQWIYYEIKDEFLDIITNLLGYIEKDSLLEHDQKNFKILYTNNILAIRKLHNSQKRFHTPV